MSSDVDNLEIPKEIQKDCYGLFVRINVLSVIDFISILLLVLLCVVTAEKKKKLKQQCQLLPLAFVDLTKLFDLLDRKLFPIFKKVGCPETVQCFS